MKRHYSLRLYVGIGIGVGVGLGGIGVGEVEVERVDNCVMYFRCTKNK